MLWTDKYRPKSFDDVVGNVKQKAIIQKWVEKWKNGEPQPPLLLIGPAGTGKTTIAHIIADEFSEYIELNASDKRSHDLLMTTIGESANTYSLFGNNRKLIIMDEVDGIHGTNDRGGTKALNKIIKESKQPIVMMANDFYSNKLTTIKKNAQVIKMDKIKSPSINKYLRDVVLKNEEIEVDKDVLMKLSKRSSGDLRSAVNTLQALVENGGELTEEALDSTSQKDNTSTIFDAVTRVLKSKNPEHVKRSLFENNEDPTLVMEYIAENIPREYESNLEVKKAYEMISQADLYFGRTRSSQYYGYWKYASDFMGVGVSVSKRDTYRKFSKVVSPMAFTMMGRTRGKRALRDQIASKMEEKMHVSLQVAYTIFPYFEIMFENDEVAWEISDFLELEDDEIKFFRKKKIPKKVIKEMEKIKAEMREEEKEEWRNSIKEGIFREIPPQSLEETNDIDDVNVVDNESNQLNDVNVIDDANEVALENRSHENATVVDIFDDFDDEELDEIASEFSSNNKSKLREDNSKSGKKKKEEEKLDKGQTTLFSF